MDLSNLSLNPNPVTYDVSYTGSVYAFFGVGGFTMDQCFNTIELLPQAKIFQYDVTQAVQVLFDVRTFNEKMGLYKDDYNQYVRSSTFDISSDCFNVDSITISASDFQQGVVAAQVISVGTYSSMYSDYIEFVNTYFGYAGGFSSLFAEASEFDINQGVFDANSFVNLLYPYTDVSGENVKPLTGSITISNINNLLRYSVDSNVFNNRNPATANIVDACGNIIEPGSTMYDTYTTASITDGSGNASDICGNVLSDLQKLYKSNYGTADGFIAGDLFFIPTGTTIKLHIDIDAEAFNPLNNTGSTNVVNLISKQDFKSKYGTSSANYFTESSTASITNIDRTLTAPLLIKLANLSNTEDRYSEYDTSFNPSTLPIRHYMDSPYRQYTGGAVNNTTYLTPSAPTGVSGTTDNGQTTLSFTNPTSSGGTAITNYEYSIDGGAYTQFNPAVTKSPATISGLTNGTEYTITIRAINYGGTGTASESFTITPSIPPTAPTDLIGTAEHEQVTITFIDPSSNGGTVISNYQYSINAGETYTDFSPVVKESPVTIGGLTNGTEYIILLRAVNAAGSGTASDSITIKPYTTPSEPTTLSGTYGDAEVTIAFADPNNGGSEITNYQYSIDAGETYTDFSPIVTASPVTITGLTNGTEYTILLRAVNVAGSGSVSDSITITPYTTPSAPTSLSGIYGDGEVTISFEKPRSLGIGEITNYQYSINTGETYTDFSPLVTTSPVIITGLTNGTEYTILLRAVNTAGSGTASDSIIITPYTIPSAPTSLSGTAGDSQLTIAFTDPTTTGGSEITNYEYSIDNGSEYIAFDPQTTTSPVTITGLTNGTEYTILLRAVNTAGSGTVSDSIIITPYTIPSSPTSLNGTIGDSQVTIAFTDPTTTGGSEITNYEYSIDNGSEYIAFDPQTTTSPVTITGLTNGTEYTILLRAVNTAGSGTASDSITIKPYTIPSAPTSLSGTAGDSQVTIAFTDPTTTGGSEITNYEYSIDNGSEYIAFDPQTTTSPVTITGLTNGTEYTILLRAVNAAGSGTASDSILIKPYTIPSAPTSLSGTAGDSQVTIEFTDPTSTGGSEITNYLYSIDAGETYSSFSPEVTASPITITGLTNGTEYTISLKPVNAAGSGTASDAISIIPNI